MTESGAPNLLPGGLSEDEFTEVLVDLYRRELPDYQIEVVEPLALRIVFEAGRDCRSQLDNLWAFYKRGALTRTRLDDVFASLRERGSVLREEPSLDDVVVLLKGAGFVAQAEVAAERSPDPERARLVTRPWKADLFQVFAFDSPHSLRYVSQGDLESLGVRMEALVDRGVQTARSRMGEVEAGDAGAVTVLRAGGTFESSLLLMDGLWQDIAGDLGGELVVAVPVRDVVLVAPVAEVVQVGALAGRIYQEGPYSVSAAVLTYRPGKGFEPMDLPDPGEPEPDLLGRVRAWLGS